MTEMNGLNSPVVWAIVLICVLGVGFLLCFLAALLAEARKQRARLLFRLKAPQVSREDTCVPASQAAASALPVAIFSQRIASIGEQGKSVRPVATLEISGRW